MPNWVRNIVTVPEKIVPIIKEKYCEKECFTFNKVIPMPKELMVTKGSVTDDAITYALSFKNVSELLLLANKLKIDKFMYETLTNPEKMEKLKDVAKNYYPYDSEKELGIKTLRDFGEHCINNALKYGATTWYDWAYEHWNTKWDASFIGWEDNKMIFNTAWSSPEAVLKELSKQFPNEEFNVQFADEDFFGDNKGIITYKNGEMIRERDISTEYAAKKIWECDDWEMYEEELE